MLGLYYGGVGLGIIVSALILPPLTALPVAHAWQWAWVGLAACASLATVFTACATRGIDGAAKYEIYSIIAQLAADGCGVLMISSDIEEVMGVCDRMVVMSRGEIVAAFPRAAFNKEAILRAAFREQEAAA